MGSTRTFIRICGLLLLTASVIAGCDSLPFIEEEDEGLKASGVVEAVEIAVAPQVGGRVAEVFVKEGDPVLSEDRLFQLEDTLLSSQYEGATAGFEAAQANLEAALASLDLAQASLLAARTAQELAHIQHQAVLNLARFEEQENRTTLWSRLQPDEFETPPWYFTKLDEKAATEAEIVSAKDDLDEQLGAYAELLQDPEYADLLAAELRLAQAQAAFLVAQSMLEREMAETGGEQLQDSVQTLFDNARAELEAAQKALDEILGDETAEEILTAKAGVTTAQERYETALDLWASTLTGDQSLQVRVAMLGLDQAQANVAQAEAAISQAEAGVTAAEKLVDQALTAVKMVEIQTDELTVYAPDSGVILVRNVEPGELVLPGATAMTIGQLDELTVTVYISEDRYGQIDLGDLAIITTDSFPNEIFQAIVTRIADQAEYTPRNVGTEGDRSTIVFAVELSVDDPNYKLKPGMPVDVGFVQK